MNNGLPGADLIEAGLADLHAGCESIAALLVAIGSPRLRRLGLDIPDHTPENPEHRLYDCWRKMILIPPIRVTMPIFAD